jgi:hypothetical protein
VTGQQSVVATSVSRVEAMTIQSQTYASAVDAIPAEAFAGDEVGRLQAVAATKRFLARLQTPSEQVRSLHFLIPFHRPELANIFCSS